MWQVVSAITLLQSDCDLQAAAVAPAPQGLLIAKYACAVARSAHPFNSMILPSLNHVALETLRYRQRTPAHEGH
jgi:hypothetical protein